ncbi:MAG TPA: hypothetical protein VEW26_13680 [Allosphingosinicella sp.]|nr:hypothetical protein [Allosphingosinicella sp.]
MITTAQLTRMDLDLAIAAAAPRGKALEGLNAPPDGAALGMLDEIWTAVSIGLQRAYELGADKAREIGNATAAAARNIIDRAGEAAGWLRDKLRESLQKLMQGCIERAIALLGSSYKVGDATVKLKSLQVGQKISLSGEIEASIQRVFSLVATGELSVAASYE